MALLGYARVSTTDQHLDGQIAALTEAGCVTIYQEKASGSKGTTRPEFNRMLADAKMGDTIVVAKLDRFARSTSDLLNIVERLNADMIGFKVLNAPMMDTTSATGMMVIGVLAVIAQFERSMMLERQKDGIARARAEGKYTGRAPTAQRQSHLVVEALALGMTREAAATACGVSVASVYRIQRAARAAARQPATGLLTTTH